ncbi:MAG: D-alanyl-D-alanine carboxypeptidase family protein [Ruminococcaceae bacterium]|nr:D-alanyl-D-alanine carboxypeptidase family protein [Oscillospiraceae bacterium]
MKKILISATALLCMSSLISCNINSSVPTETLTPTPSATPTYSTPADTETTLTPMPPVSPDTTVKTPDITPTVTPTPTPITPVNKFDSYTAVDFDMTVDKTDPNTDYVICGKGLFIKGDLALVNETFGYNSKYTSELSTIKEEKEGYISVSAWGLQCTPETMYAIDALSTAYEIAFPDAERTLIVQEAFKKSSNGGTRAYSSEYLTGRMLKLLFWDGQYTYKVDNIEMKAEKQWLQTNCAKYGFVIRYDNAKEEITGVSGNNSEFRYVGVPHSYYMNETNLCLEEYLERITSYSFENRLSYIDPTGDTWEMYYVKGESEGKTRIPVDKDAEYTISGDNKGGYIITVKKNDLKSIEYVRLLNAIESLKNKAVISYDAKISLLLSEDVTVEEYKVLVENGAFKSEFLSNYTVVYKDGMLYLTDLEGNTDSTEFTYDSAMKKYLPRLKTGASVVIIPSQDSLFVGSVESMDGGYVYTLHLRDKDLIEEQNIAFFGKAGFVSKVIVTVTVKDKEVVQYKFTGKTSSGAVYDVIIDFNNEDGLKVEVPSSL